MNTKENGMSEKINNGGPAFPHQDSGDTGTRPGMPLRAFFAATVGTNDLACVRGSDDRETLAGRPHPADYPSGLDSIKFNMQVEAALRMMYADAMLAALEVQS